MLLENIPFCQQNGMRANLFKSAGHWLLLSLDLLHKSKGNLIMFNRILATPPCGQLSQHQKELDHTKLAA